MEILELQGHPYFVGVQFHPEYLSRVLEPSKPYLGFVAASAGCLDEVIGKVRRRDSGDEKDGEGCVNGVGVGEADGQQDLSAAMDGVKI